MRSHSQGFAGH